MKVIGGIVGIIIVVIGFFLFSVFVNLMFYGLGWSFGWTLNLFVGPAEIGGITFPQLFGIMYVFIMALAGTFIPLAMANNKKIEQAVNEKIKNYRGY